MMAKVISKILVSSEIKEHPIRIEFADLDLENTLLRKITWEKCS